MAYILGDVNNDGQVDVTDLQLVKQHITHTITLTGDAFTAADVNADGVVDSADSQLIAQYLSGTITHFPGEDTSALTMGVAWANIMPYLTASYYMPVDDWQAINTSHVMVYNGWYQAVINQDCTLEYSGTGGVFTHNMVVGYNYFSWTPSGVSPPPPPPPPPPPDGVMAGVAWAGIWSYIINAFYISGSYEYPINQNTMLYDGYYCQVNVSQAVEINYQDYYFNLNAGWNNFTWEPGGVLPITDAEFDNLYAQYA